MMWVLLVLVAVIVAAPFVLEHRKPDMDDAVRAGTNGNFAKLSDGHTHFKWHGPEDGPVLVCIHGLTTPSFVWAALLPGLTAAGYRVLTYDLYGRGWSDRPSGAQTRSFFIRQLRDLLDHQKITGDITVMGYSMGGSIATIFAAEEPDRVSRVILLAPAGMEHNPTRFAEFVRLAGHTGKWAMLAFGGYELRRNINNSQGPSEFSEKQITETKWRGFLPAVLSSQRNILAETLEEEHRAIQTAGLPVCAIWGESDTVIPLSSMGMLTEWNRDVRHSTVPNAGHGLGVTHAEDVLEAMASLVSN